MKELALNNTEPKRPISTNEIEKRRQRSPLLREDVLNLLDAKPREPTWILDI